MGRLVLFRPEKAVQNPRKHPFKFLKHGSRFFLKLPRQMLSFWRGAIRRPTVVNNHNLLRPRLIVVVYYDVSRYNPLRHVLPPPQIRDSGGGVLLDFLQLLKDSLARNETNLSFTPENVKPPEGILA